MPYTSGLMLLAEAVRSAIQSHKADLAIDAGVTPELIPYLKPKLEDLPAHAVYVAGKGATKARESRGQIKVTLQVDVAAIVKADATTNQIEAADAAAAIAERVAELFETLQALDGYTFTTSEILPYSVELIEQAQLGASRVTLTFETIVET